MIYYRIAKGTHIWMSGYHGYFQFTTECEVTYTHKDVMQIANEYQFRLPSNDKNITHISVDAEHVLVLNRMDTKSKGHTVSRKSWIGLHP